MNIYFDTEFTEIWLDVLNYEGLYEVSNLGKIRNKKRPAPCGAGQRIVIVRKNY